MDWSDRSVVFIKLPSTATFSHFNPESNRPDEETETALLYGQAEVGSAGTAALDTARVDRNKRMKVGRAKTAKGRKVRRSLFKRKKVKKKWKPAVSLSVGDQKQLSPQEERAERLQLIAEILVMLFDHRAGEVAHELASGIHNKGIALANGHGRPQVTKRYGPRPGPGWVSGGVSALGTPIWLWGPSTGHAAAPPPPAAPSAGPIPPPAPAGHSGPAIAPPAAGPAPAPPAPAGGFHFTPIPVPTNVRRGGQAAKAASIAAYNVVMTKLSQGQQLTAVDKAALATKLTNIPVSLLRNLHGALGGGHSHGLLAPNVVNQVRSILAGGATPAVSPLRAAPAPLPQTPASAPGLTPAMQNLASGPPITPVPGARTPVPTSTPVSAQSLKLTIPFNDETDFETGKAQPGTLNGIDFAPAPPKFWEKVKDVDVKEPPPLKRVDRAGVLIQEPDGRIWIVQPTGGFGSRKYTIPGGGVEAGLTTQQNALKEVWEETGLQVEITGHLGDFEDSNNKNNGRLYIGKRVGGAPWDAKIEPHIPNPKTGGMGAAESEKVTLVTPERAAKLLHRTDDLAQLMTVQPMPLNQSTSGKGSEPLKKLLAAINPKADDYSKKKTTAGMDPGDAQLHAVQQMRKFNAKPKVVSKSDFDAVIAKGGHIEMLRGVNGHGNLRADKIADQFRDGDHFPGYGCFGNGTYADSNKGPGNYGINRSAVIRMAIPKSAKIIKQSDLEMAVPNPPDAFTGQGGGHGKNDCWLGVHAALAGYDAIYVDGKSSRHSSYGTGFYVILNRGIVTVQKEDAKGYTIT